MKPQIMLAPMEGVMDFILRELYSLIGGFDQMVTEFIRVTHRLNPPKVFYSYCPELHNKGKTLQGVPVWIQLLGSKPHIMADNARLAYELGAPGIDLNFGCPAKTVNQHDGGASLLKKPERLYDVITAVKRALPAQHPVSAKVRLGYEDKSLHRDIAQAVQQAQACHLTIHARTKKEGYRPPAHWEFIRKMKEEVQIPVYANGDIGSPEDFQKCYQVTRCKRVALGRGALKNPFLALELKGITPHISLDKTIIPLFLQKAYRFRGEKFALSRLKQWYCFLDPKVFHDIKRVQSFKNLAEIKKHWVQGFEESTETSHKGKTMWLSEKNPHG